MATRKYTPETVVSTCVNCAKEFYYLHSTGMRRRHCSDLCRTQWQIARAKVRKDEYPLCSVVGCCKPAIRVAAGQCEMHYGRKRRGAPENGRAPAYRYTTQAGYIAVFDPSHPLSMKNGRVHEHRMVAYALHDGKCPSCFWCASILTWRSAVIDHLDENKENNTAANLVVACSPCNRARGAALPFIRAMTPESFKVFVDQAAKYRQSLCATHHSRDKQRIERIAADGGHRKV